MSGYILRGGQENITLPAAAAGSVIFSCPPRRI